MKTSLAKTFQDFKHGKSSCDGIFPNRTTIRIIQDENDQEVAGTDVVVVLSYDEELGPTESTSTLLVNQELRKEYESLQKDLFEARDKLVAGVKKQANTKQDVEKLISLSFAKEDDNFFVALSKIEKEIKEQTDTPFVEVPYDILFNEEVRAIAETPAFGKALTDYVTLLNELLDKSLFFSRDTFSYYNANKVTKSLSDNRYFQANHTLTLKGSDEKETNITNAKELEEIIAKEQKQITEDEGIRKKLLVIKKQLEKTVKTRAFYEYVAEHVEILPELSAFNLFENKVWKSYLKSQDPLYTEVVIQWGKAEKRYVEIENQAAAESTQWEQVIKIFNERFFVPFRLTVKNRERVVLGREKVLQLGFEFQDEIDRDNVANVEKEKLLEVLSNGEKKALYILNVLFEIETRKTKTDTLLVIDDLADSFDYKNKYAIVQYLHEMTEISNFKLVILTHNFDFFRTLNGRGIAGYQNCLTTQRALSGALQLVPAAGIKNPFIKDFKPNFFRDPRKRIASIPFMRNILEYTKGEEDPDYIKLTSILHWKADSSSILNADLDAIFVRLFGDSGKFHLPNDSVINLVSTQAEDAASAPQGINFENKIILSIAIRLLAERYMATVIADPKFLDSININQFQVLYKKYRDEELGSIEQRKVLDSVLLMTPENLHVNSFMYEPIIDLADDHLRKLYHEVIALSTQLEPQKA